MPYMRRQDRVRLAEWADAFNLQERAYTEAEWYDMQAEADGWEPDPDAAYERHLENLGWEAAELDRQMEDRAGVMQFEDEMVEVNSYAERRPAHHPDPEKDKEGW